MGTGPAWFTTHPHWSSHPDLKSELLSPANCTTTPNVTIAEVMRKSAMFPRKFPVDTVRCHNLLKNRIPESVLEKNINSTYPIIHEHALYLCCMFLAHQKEFGNGEFYRNMGVLDLVERLLSKRAVSFAGETDEYMLLDGTEGSGGWESVGTKDEKPPLVLENCLSYDEMKLSAFLSVSSHTVFLNDGNRHNCGVFETDKTKIEENGVIMGLIGTRMHRPNVMEYRDIIKSRNQNTHQYGYGKSAVPTLQSRFSKFYGDVNFTFEEILPKMKQSKDRYLEVDDDEYFDIVVYCRRISLSIDTLLIEANERARKVDKMAYVHVVGLGLGVWRVHRGQDKLFMDTFAQRLKLLTDVLTNISDVCFAFILHKMADEYKDGDSIGHVKLHMIDKVGPHVKLTGTDEGKLLVVSYAWDSNALPGNEFWCGYLHTSSDPAAASSTQVAELHNWHINPKCSGGNLRVATLKGVVTFQEYQEMHR